MRDGICPKCESKEIYVVEGDQNIIDIPLGMLANSALVSRYVCVVCGYIEHYVDDQNDLREIARKWRKF